MTKACIFVIGQSAPPSPTSLFPFPFHCSSHFLRPFLKLMAKNLSQFLSTLSFIIAVMNFPALNMADDTLYAPPPPPAATSSNGPPPPSGSEYYFSPPFGYYSQPSGYITYYPPPWYLNNAPPPPDPIWPFFPYYSQQPPPLGFSSATHFNLNQPKFWISSLILTLLLCVELY